jgi:hypothetical protein
MTRYKNLSGESGVDSFELKRASIVIRFTDGATYWYTARSAGARAVAQMKKLALMGKGLATFVNKYVREKYERRLE